MSDTAKQKNNSKRKAPPKAWKPGQSGNPKGRPKKGFTIADRIRGIVSDDDWRDIIEVTIIQAKSGDKDARAFLVDRTDGKPTQTQINIERDPDEVIEIG